MNKAALSLRSGDQVLCSGCKKEMERKVKWKIMFLLNGPDIILLERSETTVKLLGIMLGAIAS